MTREKLFVDTELGQNISNSFKEINDLVKVFTKFPSILNQVRT